MIVSLIRLSERRWQVRLSLVLRLIIIALESIILLRGLVGIEIWRDLLACLNFGKHCKCGLNLWLDSRFIFLNYFVRVSLDAWAYSVRRLQRIVCPGFTFNNSVTCNILRPSMLHPSLSHHILLRHSAAIFFRREVETRRQLAWPTLRKLIFGKALLVLLFFWLVYNQDFDTLIASYAQVYRLVGEG